MTELIRSEEPTPVQLTRMEGVLNLVAERVSNLAGRVAGHDREFVEVNKTLAILLSTVQRLSEQAVARDATALALAAALKEADDQRRTKSEQSWTPFQRGIALIAGLAALVALYVAFVPTH